MSQVTNTPSILQSAITSSSFTINLGNTAFAASYYIEIINNTTGITEQNAYSKPWTFTGLYSGTAYTVRGCGVDSAGLNGPFSSKVVTTLGAPADVTPPSVPTISLSTSGSSVTVSWNYNSDAVLYEIFRGSVSQGTTSSTSFTQTISDGTYAYSVRARDSAGNWSAPSSTSYVTVDSTPPTVPNLSGYTSGTYSYLSWNTNADAAQYEIYRNGTSQGTATVTSFSQGGLSDGTYSYTVRARDSVGNWSAQSSAVSLTVDTTAPTVPTIASVTGSAHTATVTWNTNADIALYEVFRGGVYQGTTASNTFSQTVSDGTYSYTVRGRDAAGNYSAQSGATSITIDTTAPSVPVVSAVSRVGSSVTVSWNSNTDVTLYEVFRGGVSQGSLTSSPFTQTVTDGTYSYTVRARDAAGNFSAQTSGSSITVDTTPPVSPTVPNKAVSHTGNSISISWASVSDAVSYEVFRDNVSVGTTTTTTFTESGLTSGSYSYTVRSKDAAGNWSTKSSPVHADVEEFGLHAPPAVKTADPTQLDYTVGQRILDGEDNIRFDRE